MGRGFLVTIALLLASAPLFGQIAELSGTVKDPSGASAPNAKVEVRNQETGVRQQTVTNDQGFYSIPALKPGTYVATVQAKGFKTLTREAIVLNVGDRASLDFSLQVGGFEMRIEVTSQEAPITNKIDASVGTVVDQQFVANMPLNGRSFQSLIQSTPGVVIVPSAQDAPGQFSVNGQRSNTNYFMIDGVSANFGSTPSVTLGQTLPGSVPALTIGGGTNGLVSADAMQEFRIQTSSYAPEFGRMPGAQVSILTKGGTNQWHGTAYDYMRNDLFDARNWFNQEPQPKPPLRQNDFGGTFGGPIIKDRTFLFFSYEGLRLRQPQTDTGNFLTAAARANVADSMKALVNAFPLPNGPVNSDGITAPLTVSDSAPSSFDVYSLRLDHNLTNNIILFGRYNHAPSTSSDRYFANFSNYIANVDTATAGATLTFTPRMVNEFRANWSRCTGEVHSTIENLYGAVAPPESAIFTPGTSGKTAQVVFGTMGNLFNFGTRIANVQRQFNIVDVVAVTEGTHQLKFGVDFRRMHPTNGSSAPGYLATQPSYSQLQSGNVSYVSAYASDAVSTRTDNYSLFAQDTWKLTDRLTLTYGLRWEVNTPPSSTESENPLYAVQGLFDTNPLGLAPPGTPLWNTRYLNFAPRIGLAFELAPTTVLRGGFGLFYDLGYPQTLGGSVGFPYLRKKTSSGSIPFDFSRPEFQAPPFSTTLLPNTNLVAVDPDIAVPVTYQWNVALQREFGENQSVTATYVGAYGKDLLRYDRVIPTGSTFETAGGGFNVTHNAGYSRYHALQLQFRRRMSRGLQALISYTLSKSVDTASNESWMDGQSVGGSLAELRVPPAAPSNFDARHNFSAAFSYQLPAPAGKPWQALFRGWAFDGVERVTSGRSLNVLYQRLYGTSYYDVQPDTVPGQPFWISDYTQPRNVRLNPAAFAIPAGANGNFPRNSLRGFPISQTDLALRRRFELTDRVTLDFRVESFNLFNHPMFADPFNLWGVGTTAPYAPFGKIQQTLNLGLGGGGLSGGQSGLYAIGGPRSHQFTLKLSF